MDTRLLRYYERELQHLREMGGEFAKEFPKIAGRLGLETYSCADPYVERLLEGFSFLAARVQLKIDAEFPRFTQHMLEMVYPHYLAPTPSMAVVQLQPNLSEGSLAEGFTLPRGTALHSLLGKGDQTACEYRTGHDVTLWPLELVEARYQAFAGEYGGIGFARLGKVKSLLRIRLRATAGLKFNELMLDKLPFFLQGSDALPAQLLEQLLANALGMAVVPALNKPSWHELIPASAIRHVGFEDDEALLPYGPRSFQGYRLLHEYFAFPQRFLFVELGGLRRGMSRCADTEIDLLVLFDKLDPLLEQIISKDNFVLFATPAINLFSKRTDRIHLTQQVTEFHVVPDRTRPQDFEVYQVLNVRGYGAGVDAEVEFRPFYAADDLADATRRQAYYQVRRTPRLMSDRQRLKGPRSSYMGSEVFLSLVDAQEAPFRSDLRQLGIETLCTNRDLPLTMPIGAGKTDFVVETSAPVLAVRCVSGPTPPSPSYAEGDTAWRLISHLSLNYLSLVDSNAKDGAAGLRDLLRLYSAYGDAGNLRQIDGVSHIRTQPIARRLPVAGPICYGRGLEVTLTVDETAFRGVGVILFGAVMERFFAKYVSINAFTEMVLSTTDRGEIMRWAPRIGTCAML
ncbi:type VI secretion system protein ImpG [Chitinivorax tropicus]|uniref:Type VI secretion system protein ImpG n=1 Tax=Chitinivorax tropicus TaxID=714531 RepID=A0A840MYB3_9PROT|nr:type VI secretion system baseplate subunit TssF [Chitinivorax tropicus]MBB5020141.1 type VI secretion system protein ImpG [Chitinivorax tropicus]